MKKTTALTLSILSLFVIAGCEKEEASEFTDSPIIESYLEPGNYLNVKISRQIPFTSDVNYSSDDINNLAINVVYNNGSHTLTSLGNGLYVDSSLIVTEGVQYDISFVYNEKNVKAYTKIPSKPQNYTQSVTQISIERMDGTFGPPTGTMPDPVELAWDNTDGSYYIVVIDNIETTLDPIRDFGDNAPPGNRFRKSPTAVPSTEIRAMEFQYYGTHRIVLYHVLPDYASLYDDNSTSSQNLTNPSTSIVNGYGIFTGLNSDTLFIEVKEL
ncbi:MAG: DUF4249 family protein [Bacteroidota bacterium]